MDVIRAKTAGFCMGVGLALQKLDTALEQPCEGRTCTLGPIIHNPQVLADYEARGVFCAQDPSQLDARDRVLIRAHGITRQVEEAVRATGADVVDATCPKVKRAQLAIERATRDGAELLLFGEADHPEVRGLVSYAHGPAHVFGSRDELTALHVDPGQAYVLASQTTQDRSVFEQLEQELRDRLPRLTVLATICDATRERQEEARSIAARVDVMVVVGGRQSGNTRRLADLAAQSGISTYHIEQAEELRAEDFAGKTRVGLTAGASTPRKLIDATQHWLEQLPESEETQTALEVTASCKAIAARLEAACDARAGRIEDEGLRVVLCGRPNAGKSSLLNALLGGERVLLTDTAGLRETGDAVERIGVERAKKALAEADVRALVLDGASPLTEEDKAALFGLAPQLIILSKGDLAPVLTADEVRAAFGDVPTVAVCAPRGEGMEALKEALAAFVPEDGAESSALSQARHVEAARRACAALSDAVAALSDGMPLDVAAVDLSAALDALGEITGETMSEKVIDEVFAKFCVGK